MLDALMALSQVASGLAAVFGSLFFTAFALRAMLPFMVGGFANA